MCLMLTFCHPKNPDKESSVIAANQNDEKFTSKAAQDEAEFVVDALSKSYAEINLTEIAEQRAVNSEVRDVAIALNKEHTILIAHLKDYAGEKAISIPTDASDKSRNALEKLLAQKEQRAFDREWCKQAGRVNKATIEQYEKAAASLTDGKLKNWTSEALRDIRKSHDKVMACEKHLQ
jgi:predicted outer membrane protein